MKGQISLFTELSLRRNQTVNGLRLVGTRRRSESAGVVSAVVVTRALVRAVVPTMLHLGADNITDCAAAKTANKRTGCR